MNATNLYRSIFAILLGVGLLLGCSRSRSDAQIASEIQSKVNSDSNISTKDIGVETSNGVVTLSGAVASEFERTAAGNGNPILIATLR